MNKKNPYSKISGRKEIINATSDINEIENKKSNKKEHSIKSSKVHKIDKPFARLTKRKRRFK